MFMQRILQNSGLLPKTEQEKKTEQAVHGNSRILPDVCAAHRQTERGRPKLLPAASRSPLYAPRHAGDARPPIFCV